MFEGAPGVTGNSNQITSNFHIQRTPTPTGVDTNVISDGAASTLPFSMIDGYYVYGVRWDRNWVKIYADGMLIRQKATASFTLAERLFIGNELNSYFSPTVDNSRLPATFNIQYVRTWILPENPTIYYVDGTNGNDTNSGLSWAQAKKSIRSAIDASYDGDSVYVAQGTYTEYVTVYGTQDFQLYGGFLPGQTLAQRNSQLYQSVIQAPPDGYGPIYLRSGQNLRVDGFTLTGTTNNYCHGISLQGPLTNTFIANCRLVNNSPFNGSGGGSVVIGPDAPTYVSFQDCQFTGNTLLGASAGGGAAYVGDGSSATFQRCLFASNTVSGPGAAAESYWELPSTRMRFENCIFRGNSAPANNGTLDLNCGNLEVINCTFATNSGDGIHISNGNTAAQQSIVLRNTIVDGCLGNGLNLSWSGASAITTMSNSLFFGNSTQVNYAGTAQNTASAINANSWAKGNQVANPLFLNRAGFDYHLTAASPALDTGTANLATTNDFAGVTRPLGLGYDLGAYEAGTSLWSYTGTAFTYNGSAQTPAISFSGSTGAKTTNYVGTGYVSVNPPTNDGTYFVSNTVAADTNYFAITNSQNFTINPKTASVTANPTNKICGGDARQDILHDVIGQRLRGHCNQWTDGKEGLPTQFLAAEIERLVGATVNGDLFRARVGALTEGIAGVLGVVIAAVRARGQRIVRHFDRVSALQRHILEDCRKAAKWCNDAGEFLHGVSKNGGALEAAINRVGRCGGVLDLVVVTHKLVCGLVEC